MITPERVLAILQLKGPSLPVQIKKALGEGDTVIVGAVLTDLIRSGKVKTSAVRRGGSPFYLVPEHRSRLVNFIGDLGEKDRRTAELLQQKKILRDREQDPLVRVALRQIKDYATPIEVSLKDGKEIFWKWFLVPNEEAEKLVKEKLGIRTSQAAAEIPVKEPPEEHKAPRQREPEEQKTPPESVKSKEEQQPLATPASKVDDEGDGFLRVVLDYFADKHIQVITKMVLRKNSDLEFELSVPTAVGRMSYWCKAKSKKKCNEGDLSSAYVQGQVKKLPVLFVTTGEITKKAKEKLKTDFKGLMLVEL